MQDYNNTFIHKISHISSTVYKLFFYQFHNFLFLIKGKEKTEIREFEDLVIA